MNGHYNLFLSLSPGRRRLLGPVSSYKKNVYNLRFGILSYYFSVFSLISFAFPLFFFVFSSCTVAALPLLSEIYYKKHQTDRPDRSTEDSSSSPPPSILADAFGCCALFSLLSCFVRVILRLSSSDLFQM